MACTKVDQIYSQEESSLCPLKGDSHIFVCITIKLSCLTVYLLTTLHMYNMKIPCNRLHKKDKKNTGCTNYSYLLFVSCHRVVGKRQVFRLKLKVD